MQQLVNTLSLIIKLIAITGNGANLSIMAVQAFHSSGVSILLHNFHGAAGHVSMSANQTFTTSAAAVHGCHGTICITTIPVKLFHSGFWLTQHSIH